jgi:hypothetical protein
VCGAHSPIFLSTTTAERDDGKEQAVQGTVDTPAFIGEPVQGVGELSSLSNLMLCPSISLRALCLSPSRFHLPCNIPSYCKNGRSAASVMLLRVSHQNWSSQPPSLNYLSHTRALYCSRTPSYAFQVHSKEIGKQIPLKDQRLRDRLDSKIETAQ